MIKVTIPNDIGEKVTKLAKGKKTTQEEIVVEALRYYLPIVEEGLEDELKAWDKLSDEALANFEAALKEKEL